MKISYGKKLAIMSIVASMLIGSADSVGLATIDEYGYGDNLARMELSLAKNIEQMEEEFRGVWVSTVYNLDHPKKKGMSKQDFQKSFLDLLDRAEDLNLNSIIYQVRPRGDAFYQSDLNPWSEFLTGMEGKDPGWDPLEWMIEETHKRGLEFQAWFNPYRVSNNYSQLSKEEDLASLSKDNWARKNPDYVFKYNGKLYLNPGQPEVIDFVTSSIMEVVENYKIDAVHLDDYFYPSRRENIESFYGPEEQEAFKKYGSSFEKVSDWRRNNVDRLVEKIHLSLKSHNNRRGSQVRFGISPFGIWGHLENHPEASPEGVGSKTPVGSMASYDYQFADSRKWVKNKWLDYIAPQVYWTFDEKAAPYGEIVDWWAGQVRGTGVDLYIGHASYKKKENSGQGPWSNSREISNQLNYNKSYDEIKGSVFFRYESLLKDSKNQNNNDFIDILKKEHYYNKAKIPGSKLRPLGPVKKEEAPAAIEDLRVELSLFGNMLNWKDPRAKDSKHYLVYREELIDSQYRNKILLGKAQAFTGETRAGYLDSKSDSNKKYRYSVIRVDLKDMESGSVYR